MADESLQLSHDRMTGKAHPGISQVGYGLSVKCTTLAKDIERHAGQRQLAGLLEENPVTSSRHRGVRG